MRAVNGLPLLLAAMMLSAGMIPAAAQEAGDTGEVSVVDLVSDTGGGAVETSVDEGGFDLGTFDGATDEDVTDYSITIEPVEEEGDYSITFDLVEDDLNGPAPEDLVQGGPEEPVEDYVIDLGAPFGDGSEPEVLPGVVIETMDGGAVETMLTATGAGGDVVVPGSEEVQRSVTVQQGGSSGSDDDSCSALPLAKRPLACD